MEEGEKSGQKPPAGRSGIQRRSENRLSIKTCIKGPPTTDIFIGKLNGDWLTGRDKARILLAIFVLFKVHGVKRHGVATPIGVGGH
jgi:hypothetical protein